LLRLLLLPQLLVFQLEAQQLVLLMQLGRVVLSLLTLRPLVADVAASAAHRCTRKRADCGAGTDVTRQSTDQRAAGRTYARANTGTAPPCAAGFQSSYNCQQQRPHRPR